MKTLSDYKGEEAIELWADILDPLSEIMTDDEVRKSIQTGKNRMVIAQKILKNHKKEAEEILLRIDPEPIDGLNIVLRMVAVVADIGKNDEIKVFLGYAPSGTKAKGRSGSAMASTKAAKS